MDDEKTKGKDKGEKKRAEGQKKIAETTIRGVLNFYDHDGDK